jgi:uncharacterized protein involved in exopolysaccharide biosynthesis
MAQAPVAAAVTTVAPLLQSAGGMDVAKPLRPVPRDARPDSEAPESDDLFDTVLVGHLLGWVFRGAWRHRLLAALVFTTVLGLGLGWMALAPRTWHVEAKLLASRSQLIRALGNPRTSGSLTEDPTRAADEIVFAHDNLVALVKQTNLLELTRAHRSALGRLCDGALELVVGPPTADEALDAMVELLEKRLVVTSDSQTVVIAVNWPDPEAAYQLVETAQRNFLESRHLSEVTAIGEAIAILQLHAEQAQTTVTAALDELERVRDERRLGLPRPPGPRELRTFIRATSDDANTTAELSQLKVLLQAKRRALSDVLDLRARRLSELSAHLAEQRVHYADKHPALVDTLERMAALRAPTPQLVQARDQLAALVDEYRRKGGVAPDAALSPSPRESTRAMRAAAPAPQVTLADLADDPLVDFARNRLRVASANAEELSMRIDSARLEQETARVAFKYRYNLVRPAALPHKPVSPKLEVLFGMSLMLAFFCALLSGAALEWWRGAPVEPWQVARPERLRVLRLTVDHRR